MYRLASALHSIEGAMPSTWEGVLCQCIVLCIASGLRADRVAQLVPDMSHSMLLSWLGLKRTNGCGSIIFRWADAWAICMMHA